jgi:two-component system invasion response regulator UvrY
MNHPVNVCYAEPHTLVRRGVINIIQSHPYFTVVADACNGKALIDKLVAMEQQPDVCILDINMPVLNGYNTVIELKRRYQHMRFLVLTECHTEYSIINMIRNGANGYLAKACQPEDLHTAIATIYREGYYYSRFASQKAFHVVRNNVLPELTEKELKFITLCCTDLTYAQIAQNMCLSVRTIEHYQRTIGEKFHLHNRVSLMLFAIQSGLVQPHKTDHS